MVSCSAVCGWESVVQQQMCYMEDYATVECVGNIVGMFCIRETNPTMHVPNGARC